MKAEHYIRVESISEGNKRGQDWVVRNELANWDMPRISYLIDAFGMRFHYGSPHKSPLMWRIDVL